MVGLGRLELPTSPLSGVRSNHLSYRPELSQFYTTHPAPANRLRPRFSWKRFPRQRVYHAMRSTMARHDIVWLEFMERPIASAFGGLP
jgi:hypothetical protein